MFRKVINRIFTFPKAEKIKTPNVPLPKEVSVVKHVEKQKPSGEAPATEARFTPHGELIIVENVAIGVIRDVGKMHKTEEGRAYLKFTSAAQSNGRSLQETFKVTKGYDNVKTFNTLHIEPKLVPKLLEEFIDFLESKGFYCIGEPRKCVVDAYTRFIESCGEHKTSERFSSTVIVKFVFPSTQLDQGALIVTEEKSANRLVAHRVVTSIPFDKPNGSKSNEKNNGGADGAPDVVK